VIGAGVRRADQNKKLNVKKSMVFLILFLGSIVLLTPLWWMISTSLKSPQEIMQYPPSFFPKDFHFSNYIEAWNTGDFTRWSLNTLLIASGRCIAMPLVKPALITVAIFSFTGAWNDLLGPLLYLSDEKLYTLQLGLQTFKGSVQTQWNYLMAMSVMVMIPTILIFFLFQRYFIKGSNISAGMKG
jgi:ABC-type glycerol-3-phosphate transport system permease component